MQDLVGITDDQALDLIKDFGVDAHCNMMGRISAFFAGGDNCSRGVAGAGQAGGGARGRRENVTTGARNWDISTGAREEDMRVYCVSPDRSTGGSWGWSGYYGGRTAATRRLGRWSCEKNIFPMTLCFTIK